MEELLKVYIYYKIVSVCSVGKTVYTHVRICMLHMVLKLKRVPKHGVHCTLLQLWKHKDN